MRPDLSTDVQFNSPAVVFDDGMSGPALYAKAYYPNAPIYLRSAFARWTGREWQVLGSPRFAIEYIGVLTDSIGSRLYAWTSHQPESATLSFWNGQTWQSDTRDSFWSLGTSNWCFPICSFDYGKGPAIYGLAEDLGNPYGMAVARWDGVQWHAIGQPVAPNNYTMGVFDLGDGPSLYFHGQFDGIAGVPNTRGIARWDGERWHALGEGLYGAYFSLCVFDAGHGKELYVAGGLSSVGTTPARFAKWNGTEWTILPFPLQSAIAQLEVFDDGFGAAIVAVGSMTSINGQPMRGFAKFDGENWHALPGRAVATYEVRVVPFNEDPRGPSLFVDAGGGLNDIGQFVGFAGGRTCYADCDNVDGQQRLAANDFMCFLTRWASRSGPISTHRDPYADCNQDLQFNAADFQCFLTKFAAGCS